VELRGHIAVVTAGGAGLGRHIANVIAARGAHVVIGDLDPDAGRTVVAEIERDGGSATFVKVDVTNDEQLTQMVARAAEFGHIRALVNNAGGWSASGLQYPVSRPADWSNVLDLNLRAPMLATQLCLEPMRSNGGGAVVNVASSGGLGPDAYGSPEYGAAKAGLIRFTSALRGLYSTHGIRVSCVVPHWVGLTRAKAEFAHLSAEQQSRSGGLIDPDVVATEVIHLIEDEESSGHIVAIRAHQPPYLLDPSGMDPDWR
jgi:NAD(P)-dependent dehydrogenase (short-subunit alcohol dehydrogenase family)